MSEDEANLLLCLLFLSSTFPARMDASIKAAYEIDGTGWIILKKARRLSCDGD